MKSPDELRALARDVAWPIVLAGLGVIFGALGMSLCHCTPHIDPSPYPCHDPQSQWCDAEQTSCCKVWEACEPHGLCENQGFTSQRANDAGR